MTSDNMIGEYTSIINSLTRYISHLLLTALVTGDVGREGQRAVRGRVVGSYVSYVWREGANMEAGEERRGSC